MARILGTGIVTLDIISDVEDYPQQDDEIRAIRLQTCRGGNAANTLVVLSQLGHHCHWCGVLTQDRDAEFVEQELRRFSIDCQAAQRVPQGRMPTSTIIRNLRNGSRTIVHYRDLPELAFHHFATLDLTAYDWLHFEGRQPEETRRMIEYAKTQHPGIPVSIEIEKPREGIESLFPLADLLLFSRHYVNATAPATTPEHFLDQLHTRLPSATSICAWGETGAWGIDEQGILHHSPACPPAQLVDTLGAGDTFNAAIIDAGLRGHDLLTTLEQGCRIAGMKCGHSGLDFL